MPPISFRKFIVIVVVISIITGVVWSIWQNNTVGVTHYTVASSKLPEVFSGIKIAQVSDLHNASFGRSNEQIIDALKAEKPALIALTGDLISSTHLDINTAMNFVRQAQKIAPCYYVSGNHEARIGGDYQKLKNSLNRAGVIVLENDTRTLKRNGNTMQIAGIGDPEFIDRESLVQRAIIAQDLEKLHLSQNYTVLLSHRPEAFKEYCDAHINLVLCGHTHGGQFRLPFVGAIVAPDQGFFPRYDSGRYTNGHTTMIISRGLGSSVIPFRFNDQPELVFITLQAR